jgi:hypothetical protein
VYTTHFYLSQSSLVKIDLDARKVAQRWDNVGTKAHAIVAWRDVFLVLDSEAAALISVNPLNGTVTRLYQVHSAALPQIDRSILRICRMELPT